MGISILIADDHPAVLRGVQEILAEAFEIDRVDTAGTTRETLDKGLRQDYDVAILDISMPGEGGLFALERIRRVKPDLPILVFSIYSEEQYGVQVIKAGGSGYLEKDSIVDNLVAAVREILEGRKYFSSSLQEWLKQTTLF